SGTTATTASRRHWATPQTCSRPTGRARSPPRYGPGEAPRSRSPSRRLPHLPLLGPVLVGDDARRLADGVEDQLNPVVAEVDGGLPLDDAGAALVAADLRHLPRPLVGEARRPVAARLPKGAVAAVLDLQRLVPLTAAPLADEFRDSSPRGGV